jgi:hypothetical protein
MRLLKAKATGVLWLLNNQSTLSHDFQRTACSPHQVYRMQGDFTMELFPFHDKVTRSDPSLAADRFEIANLRKQCLDNLLASVDESNANRDLV